MVVASPAYLARRGGIPRTPGDLRYHDGVIYGQFTGGETGASTAELQKAK